MYKDSLMHAASWMITYGEEFTFTNNDYAN